MQMSRDNCKVILTVGVFDLLNFGHFELFRRAKELVGENGRMIVAVQKDEFVTKYKPLTKLYYNWETRAKMISALRCVDEVIPYGDIDDSIKSISFNIFAVGEDQTHVGSQRALEWCRETGKEVVVLARTSGISSTLLRKWK